MEEIDVKDLLRQITELMAAGRFEIAKSAAQNVLKVDKKNFDAYIHLGNACVNLKQIDESIDAFKKALMLRADSNEALFSLGCAYFLKGDNVEAVKQFNRCEERGYATGEMYSLLEVIFIDAGDYTQALRYANKGIQLEPLNARPYLDKVQIYLLQGKTQEAVACLHEVESILPDAGDTYLVEAQIYEQAEEYDQALAVIERAIARFPQDGDMQLAKARILNSQGKYEDAIRQIGEIRKLPELADELMREIAFQESISHTGLKDLEKSAAVLEAVVEKDPQDADALYLLLNESFALKRHDAIEKYASQMLAIDGLSPRYRATAIFMSAGALKGLGREEEAMAAYRSAVRVLRQINIEHPGLMEVYAYRVMSHKELGEYEAAHSLADHLINIDPNHAAGYAFKSEIYAAQGDKEKAAQMRAKVRDLDPDVVM